MAIRALPRLLLFTRLTQMRVLTLVATYNEAENIAGLVPDIRKHLPDSSVLVVDDNSPDGTTEVVRRKGAVF